MPLTNSPDDSDYVDRSNPSEISPGMQGETVLIAVRLATPGNEFTDVLIGNQWVGPVGNADLVTAAREALAPEKQYDIGIATAILANQDEDFAE